MFILTIDGKEDEGAYSVMDETGEQILYIFEDEDDSTRYAMMLEEMGYPEMHVIEIEADAIIKTCEDYGYKYAIITTNDIVIPPDIQNDFI
jgi:hypothetical protein